MRLLFAAALQTVVTLSIGVLLFGCSVNRYPIPGPYPYLTSHASESLEISVAQSQIESTASALRQASGSDSRPRGASISIVTRPEYVARPSATETHSDVYVEALDDARVKAQAIATKEHISLGPVQSIQEILAGPGGSYSPLKGPTTLSMVRVSPSQPVVLFVAYRLGSGGGQSDLPHVISVYGLSPVQNEQQPLGYPGPNTQKIIEVDINADDKNLENAIAAVAAYETLIRQTLTRLKVPASAARVARSETFSR